MLAARAGQGGGPRSVVLTSEPVCSKSCLDFAVRNLTREDIAGRSVLEIGSRDVNGAVRPHVQGLSPAEYVGADIEAGPGVDVICPMEEIEDRFGPDRFDVVITTEVLEHVRHWQRAIANLKHVCRAGGTILVTTRSRGFAYHAYPHDYWRYELADMRVLFGDCEILALEDDPGDPGVFLKTRKPKNFREVPPVSHALYSIVLNRPATEVADHDITGFPLLWARTREGVRELFAPLGRGRRQRRRHAAQGRA
jgi:SAM-dependent methyltransferase